MVLGALVDDDILKEIALGNANCLFNWVLPYWTNEDCKLPIYAKLFLNVVNILLTENAHI